MSLTKNEALLLKEVFTKVRYDEMLERYIIHIDDYLPLNLNMEQIILLRKMCKENDIELETLPPQMKREEAYPLFKEYKRLKEKIPLVKNQEEKERLIARATEIKQQIAIGYIGLVRRLIIKKMPNIVDDQDKEDIYQIGYEELLKFIDSYDLTKFIPFDEYLRNYIFQQISRKILREKQGLNNKISEDLSRIQDIRTRLGYIKDEEELIQRITEITNFSKIRVKGLLAIEEAANTLTSVEALMNDIIPKALIDDQDLATQFSEKIREENVVKLLDLLTPIQKEIIMLYYGFINGRQYTLEEIGQMKGYTRGERARQIKDEAIKTLRLPIIRYFIDNEFQTPNESVETYLNAKKSTTDKSKIEQVEKSLISSLSQEQIQNLLNKLSPFTARVLTLYLGINGVESHSYKEISEITEKSENAIRRVKEEGMKRLGVLISEIIYQNPNQNHITQMTRSYLNKSKKR